MRDSPCERIGQRNRRFKTGLQQEPFIPVSSREQEIHNVASFTDAEYQGLLEIVDDYLRNDDAEKLRDYRSSNLGYAVVSDVATFHIVINDEHRCVGCGHDSWNSMVYLLGFLPSCSLLACHPTPW